MYMMYGNVSNKSTFVLFSTWFDQESIPHVMNPSYIIYLSYDLFLIDFVSCVLFLSLCKLINGTMDVRGYRDPIAHVSKKTCTLRGAKKGYES